jgi:hypothetical protein
MARGWAELHPDLYTEFWRDALIVNLRGTQSDDAGQLVAEKLARRIVQAMRRRQAARWRAQQRRSACAPTSMAVPPPSEDWAVAYANP